jgi:(R,R)-butanediol dehydrogenase/meso-butanediol dehydrogenase/diacetyl reductase
MCKMGRTNLCDSYYTLGLSTRGALTEFVRAPKNNRIVLLGVGTNGTFICIALQDHEVDITAIGIEKTRLDAAKKFGADHTILIVPQISPAGLLTMYGAGGYIVFETSGVKGAPTRALALTRNGGTLLLLRLNKIAQDFPFSDAVLPEVSLEISAAHVCAEDAPEAFEAICNGTALEKYVISLNQEH